MRNLIEDISQADDSQISELLRAAVRRYNELYPDWDISTISIHKATDRNEQLDGVINMLQNMKEL